MGSSPDLADSSRNCGMRQGAVMLLVALLFRESLQHSVTCRVVLAVPLAILHASVGGLPSYGLVGNEAGLVAGGGGS